MTQDYEARIKRLEDRVHAIENAGRGESFVEQAKERTPAPASVPKTGQSLEEVLGERWLLRVGIVAIIFAVGFFLKYAFDQKLFDDVEKVMLGAVFGALLIGLGEYLRRKYSWYGQTIAGGGIAVWFFTVIAAHLFYHLIGSTTALVFSAVVTAIALAYSFWCDGKAIMIISLFGAYLAPLFLVDRNLPDAALWYATIVNVGVALAFFRRHDWFRFFALPLLGSFAIFFRWSFALGESELTTAYWFLGANFVLLLPAYLWVVSQNKKHETAQLLIGIQTLLTIIAAAMARIGPHGVEAGWPMLFMAAYALAGGAVLYGLQNRTLSRTIEIAWISSLALAMASFAFWFTGTWITLSWLMLTIIFAALASGAGAPMLGVASFAATVVSFFRLAAINHAFDDVARGEPLFWNARVLLILLLALALILQSWFASLRKDKPEFLMLRNLAGLGAHLVILALILRQITYYFERQIPARVGFYRYGNGYRDEYAAINNKKNVVTSVSLALYAGLALAAGFLFKSRYHRLGALLLFAIVVLKIAFVDLWQLGTLYRLFASLGLGIILLASSFLYYRFKQRK